MKGLRRSKRLLNSKVPGDSSQENKGEALHALVDDDDGGEEEEEDVDNDRTRSRKCATEGTFSLADLNRLALKPGLTAKELANGFWNLQGRLEETDPGHKEPKDTFVKNIILGRNLEVFLEVNESLSFGKGMILQLMYAAVRVGDEDAVVRLVSMLRKRRYKKLFDAFEEALQIDLPDDSPYSGYRGLVREIVRLKIVKPGINRAVTTTYSCRNFIENFNVVRCSIHALTAIDEVLGPQVWDEVRCDKEIAADIERQCQQFYAEKLARNGVLEYLLRRKALVLSPELCNYISKYVRAPSVYKDFPHILSLIDYINTARLPIFEADDDKEENMFNTIRSNVVFGQMDQLHSLLELCVPAKSSCTVREDGLLDEPRPLLHIVKKRAKMVLDAICHLEKQHDSLVIHAGLPLQHYLFHELRLDIEQVSKYCKYCVIFLGPTSPPTLVDKVLQMVHANVPKLDIDKWKELFKQGVYPVPAYYGDQDRKRVQSSAADKMKKFRNTLAFVRRDANPYCVYGIAYSTIQDHETLEYLRPWFRVFSAALSEESKFSMQEAMFFCKRSDFRAQAMLEADMIRISDELYHEWCQKKETITYLLRLSKNLFPIYLKWYEHTKDQELTQVLQVVLFAIACAANRISEAKRVLLDMLQPPSGQDPWAKVSRRRANLLTMAACTRHLPFVKWVFLQIQAAFHLESGGKLKDVGHVSGSDRTKIKWCHHQLTIPAWQDFMTGLIPVSRFLRFDPMCPETRLYDAFVCLTHHVLDPPCPKYLMETGLLLVQTDPLAVLPLIFRIIIMKQQSISVWYQGCSFYDSPQEVGHAYDNDDGDDNDDDDKEEEERGLNGTNPAWAWGPITLLKLIELIADETTGTADTILNAKEQFKGTKVQETTLYSLPESGGLQLRGTL